MEAPVGGLVPELQHLSGSPYPWSQGQVTFIWILICRFFYFSFVLFPLFSLTLSFLLLFPFQSCSDHGCKSAGPFGARTSFALWTDGSYGCAPGGMPPWLGHVMLDGWVSGTFAPSEGWSLHRPCTRLLIAGPSPIVNGLGGRASPIGLHL